ncbi:holin family protein [Yoonia sp. 208BN28-4]|uniref:holin family protein n=1 Tax=Yoonia sp. 208BN28-4 TaxID=3126505 RepID=UPI0030B163BB
MGVLNGLMALLFGGDRNVIAETAEVFRENSENAGERGAAIQSAALQQFAQEFARNRRSIFDTVIDGVNRLPRPMMALGTLALFGAAMHDPAWFAARMQGLSLVPEPLWWLMGAVVSFYFGARHQAKGQEFQQSIAETLARTGAVRDNIEALSAKPAQPAEMPQEPRAPIETDNAALRDWLASYDR